MDALMTRLAYSRILTVRFQAIHLIANYSLLALACVVYLIVGGGWIITLGALPGAIIFLISVQAWAYRKALEGENDAMDILNVFLSSR